jgi:hypothetical protein
LKISKRTHLISVISPNSPKFRASLLIYQKWKICTKVDSKKIDLKIPLQTEAYKNILRANRQRSIFLSQQTHQTLINLKIKEIANKYNNQRLYHNCICNQHFWFKWIHLYYSSFLFWCQIIKVTFSFRQNLSFLNSPYALSCFIFLLKFITFFLHLIEGRINTKITIRFLWLVIILNFSLFLRPQYFS